MKIVKTMNEFSEDRLDTNEGLLQAWQWLCNLQAKGYRRTNIGVSKICVACLAEMCWESVREIVEACRNASDVLDLSDIAPRRFAGSLAGWY